MCLNVNRPRCVHDITNNEIFSSNTVVHMSRNQLHLATTILRETYKKSELRVFQI
jgi:hypothetical protein